jgi:hypothetical protein
VKKKQIQYLFVLLCAAERNEKHPVKQIHQLKHIMCQVMYHPLTACTNDEKPSITKQGNDNKNCDTWVTAKPIIC